MTCERCMERIVSLESGKRIPFLLLIHLSLCPNCMTTWQAMNGLFTEMRESAHGYDVDVTDRVMEMIVREHAVKPRREGVSVRIWIVVGLFLPLIMLFCTLAEPFVQARTFLGDAFLMPVSLVLGIIFTVYMVFFIISNMSVLVTLGKLTGLVR